ncbi:MAG: FAD-dependent monooxygenase, partial [Parvibaculales bacterium]
MNTILISGGGIAGLTLAIKLGQAGLPVQIISPKEQTEGFGLQLSPNATSRLAQLGIGKELAKQAIPPQALLFHHRQNPTPFLRLEMGKMVEQRYNAPYLCLSRKTLHQTLSDTANSLPSVERITAEAKSFTQKADTITLTLTDGTKLKGAALIACDGITSPMARFAFNAEPKPSGYEAWRWKTKKAGKTINLFLNKNSHHLHYPIGADETNHIAICRTGTKPKDSKNMQNWRLWKRAPLPSWQKDRMALLGDSAHPLLPSLAQGTCMAIEDAFFL